MPPLNRLNMVFVELSFPNTGNKPFPDARLVQPGKKGMGLLIPMVKITDYRHLLGIGRPNGEINAGFAFYICNMASHLFINPEMLPRFEEIDVVFREKAMRDYCIHG